MIQIETGIQWLNSPSISFACQNIASLVFSILPIDHSFLELIFELRSIHFVFRILFVFDLGTIGPILSIFVYAIPMPKMTLITAERQKSNFSPEKYSSLYLLSKLKFLFHIFNIYSNHIILLFKRSNQFI